MITFKSTKYRHDPHLLSTWINKTKSANTRFNNMIISANTDKRIPSEITSKIWTRGSTRKLCGQSSQQRWKGIFYSCSLLDYYRCFVSRQRWRELLGSSLVALGLSHQIHLCETLKTDMVNKRPLKNKVLKCNSKSCEVFKSPSFLYVLLRHIYKLTYIFRNG